MFFRASTDLARYFHMRHRPVGKVPSATRERALRCSIGTRSHRLYGCSYDCRHLIKSILILIPLFGLHSLFVMWVFYHKNEGHTIWYYISVIFKAVFGDLQVIIADSTSQLFVLLFPGVFHVADLFLLQYGDSLRSPSTSSTHPSE